MAVDVAYLTPRGLRAPVRLVGVADPARLFGGCLGHWPFALADNPQAEPFATLIQTDGGFCVRTDFDPARIHDSGVNAVCDIIAATARQRAVERTDELCLHAAAVEIGAALVVFPAIRRSGKSLLAACLAARGHRVFGDDVLPIPAPAPTIDGVATGAAMRLRLPLPNALSSSVREYISAHSGPANRQYQYLVSPQIAAHGSRAPIGALVALNLLPGERARLRQMSRGKMLKSLLHQNFARYADSGQVLSRLFGLAEACRSYELTYDQPEEAVEILESAFADQPAPAAPAAVTVSGPSRAPQKAVGPDCLAGHAPDARLAELDGECFAVSSDLSRVLHMDDGAQRIWALLKEPTSLSGAIGILHAAFPETPGTQIKSDTAAIWEKLARAGLISPV